MNEEIKEELCLIECPTIVLTLEAGVGNQTLPMILLSLSFHAQANNWSSQVNIFIIYVLYWSNLCKLIHFNFNIFTVINR